MMPDLPPDPPAAVRVAPAVAGAACAQHADRLATAACDRCGCYVCAACGQTHDAVTWCGSCVSRVGRPVVSKPPPWELADRDAVSAFFATVLQASTDPDRTFTARPTAPARSPLAFAAILMALVALVPAAVAALVTAVFDPAAAVVVMVAVAPATFLAEILVLTLWAVMSHGIARAFGGGNAGFGATVRAVSYASSPLVVAVIPGLGHVYGGIVSIGILAVGLQRTHESGSSSAAAASVGGAAATFLLGTIAAGVSFALLSFA